MLTDYFSLVILLLTCLLTGLYNHCENILFNSLELKITMKVTYFSNSWKEIETQTVEDLVEANIQPYYLVRCKWLLDDVV